jgi:hypothetical protein
MLPYMIPMPRLAILLILATLAIAGEATTPAIDWQEARRLMTRERAGQPLSEAERALVALAKTERQRLQEAGQWPPGGAAQGGATPSGNTVFLRGATTGLVPLTDLGAGTYRDADGGLYGGGANAPSPAMRASEVRLLAGIVPRRGDGTPAPAEAGGRIGLVAIGMSNTDQEWGAFQAGMAGDQRFAPGLTLINAALGSHDAVMWGSGDDPDPWSNLDERLAEAGLTPAQVQAAWLKHAIRLPQNYGPWPSHVRATAAELRLIIGKLAARLPNLRIIHLSSRSYGGWDERAQPASGEPYAYENAFAVRALILAQAGGEWSLNPDPQRGAVLAPLLRWGPYLWADGERARSDGLAWPRPTFKEDGVHPTDAGRAAVARLLAEFYSSDPSAAWARRP